MARISLSQRRRWLHVAEQAARTMNNIASNLDEEEIKSQLNDLERLNEIDPKDEEPRKET
jgi:hypothetical protein